jgi:hypothetical protein
MRKQGSSAPQMGMMFEKGAESFSSKGTNGRRRDVLCPEEITHCDEVAATRLTPDCAHWLKTGKLVG